VALLKTNVSQAFWCDAKSGEATFKEAIVSFGKGNEGAISWFDRLLKGGFRLPDNQEKPLTLLITGPPGSGKSTLALELCYRLAVNKKDENEKEQFSIYISTESNTFQIINNAESFGYKDVKKNIFAFNGDPPHPAATIWGSEKVEKWDTLFDLIEFAIQNISKIITGRDISRSVEWIREHLSMPDNAVSPDILVIDSLNIVKKEQAEQFFQRLLTRGFRKTKIIIFILDSNPLDNEHRIWEYVCDNVIRLDYINLLDYYIRTIEVIKTRYQEHVWGKQQLKIYAKPEPFEKNDDYNEKMRRAHPYREEGGVFIFPSIHYYLSQYKRLGPTQRPELASTKPEELNRILKEPNDSEQDNQNAGLPEGRCTAFIGSRGGHKSHLGYLHLLHRIVSVNGEETEKKEGCLVISLRDDEQMTRKTMGNILAEEFNEDPDSLIEYEDEDKLEILYFVPGYITPQEFFHRVFISVQRLKRSNNKLTILFNSLDQLKARFPLCAKEGIFIPGMIEMFSGEGITSIFISVDEPGQPDEQYGLLPMADLILSFHPHKFKSTDYYGHLYDRDDEYKVKYNEIKKKIEKEGRILGDTFLECIVLQVVRFSGGQGAGAKGLLELIKQEDINERSIYQSPGLHFTKLSPKFYHGDKIRQ